MAVDDLRLYAFVVEPPGTPRTSHILEIGIRRLLALTIAAPSIGIRDNLLFFCVEGGTRVEDSIAGEP